MALPSISQLDFGTITQETTPPRGKSFLFDFATNQFALKDGKMVEVHGLDALKIWIEKILRTAVNRFRAYDGTGYGCGIDNLIGSNLPIDYIREEMKRQTLEALLQHEEINSISDWQFVRDGSMVAISFTVDSLYGANRQGVNF